MSQPLTIQALRARVQAVEEPVRRRAVSFGAAGVDAALPWGGLPLGCLHEVAGVPGDAGPAVGFSTALLVRLAAARPVLWCQRADLQHEGGALYAPGLHQFGLEAERLLLVQARTTADVLWAMEEGLRSGCLAAVVGELDAVSFAESRRLQLAAEAGGVTALAIVPHQTAISGAVTRWRVSSCREDERAASGWASRWAVALTRARGGAPAEWHLEWNHAARHFAMAAGVHDRSAEPRPAQAAG